METKFEIIQQIEQLRQNKKKYKNIDDYYDKITNLYDKLSSRIQRTNDKCQNINANDYNNQDDNEIKNIILDKIKNECYSDNDVLKIKGIEKLSKYFPLFELYLIENNHIKHTNKFFNVQTTPIFNKYDKSNIIKNIASLLHLCELSHGYINKSIVFLIIFNEIFLNFQFALDHPKFFDVVKNKFVEIEKDICKLNEVINKYNLNDNILLEWKNVLSHNNNNIIINEF
jgi:hypothetical protein